MAETAKKTTNTTKKETATAVKKEAVVVDTEKEELKAQLAELQAQMKLMMQAQVGNDKPVSNKKKQVKFVNMTCGGFTLKGSKNHHIENQFESRTFTEAEARTIVTNMNKAILNGQVYIIADEDFMEECELTYAYENLLSVDDLKNLLTLNANDVCSIYRNACDEQKEIIIGMVSDCRLNGTPIDANILVELGKLSGKDFMSIEKMDVEEEK